jgi:hypothetical protein
VQLSNSFNCFSLLTPPAHHAQRGWGTFTIQAKVYFQPRWGKAPVLLPWQLCFTGTGGSAIHMMDFCERLQPAELRRQASCTF